MNPCARLEGQLVRGRIRADDVGFVFVLAFGDFGGGLVIAVFTAITGSALAWVIGTQVTYRWDERRRRREGDLAALTAFYTTYGEFFATWKVWDAYKRPHRAVEGPSDSRWQLLDRASGVEGAFESLLVKIASERRLTQTDTVMLGCFREGYQRLRESIREDWRLEWWSSGSTEGMRQYRAFKGLAEYVAFMLEQDSAAKRASTRDDKEMDRARELAITSLLAISTRADFHDKWWMLAEEQLKLADLAPAA